jgi:hypothetical protein
MNDDKPMQTADLETAKKNPEAYAAFSECMRSKPYVYNYDAEVNAWGWFLDGWLLETYK